VVKVVYFTYRGLYADNSRAIYEGLLDRGDLELTHTWLCTAATQPSFPPGVETVLYGTPDAAAVLGDADVVVANDCMSMQWTKRPGATYLQTWHGTPLKRIHHDAPLRPGWLDNPDKDVARWDLLLSPNPATTERLRHAFRYRGPMVETGYPRNDVLSGPERDDVRRRVRTELGIADGTTAVLYAPTWRDDLVFDHAGDQDFEVPIDLTVDAKLAHDLKVVFEVNMDHGFRWEDQDTAGFVKGVYDTTPTSFEPVRHFGANSFVVTYEP